MKKIITPFLFLLFIASLHAQKTIDAYKIEADGYFISPQQTPFGIVATDNFCSTIYLINNGTPVELLKSPGCGRYYTISDDRSKIAFKLIKPDGMQVPAIYNLANNTTIELAGSSKRCGQPGFIDNGYYYSDKNSLSYLQFEDDTESGSGVHFEKIELPNIIAVSKNSNAIVYTNASEQLVYLNLDFNEGAFDEITNGPGGFMMPQWSPDDNKLLYSSLSGQIFVWDKISRSTVSIGKGNHSSWSPDSKWIVFDRVEAENFKFISSDLFIASADGKTTKNISNTPDINEMYPSFGAENAIVYSTYDAKGIAVSKLNASLELEAVQTAANAKLMNVGSNVLFSFQEPGIVQDVQSISTVSGTVPYINQIYDTPDWHGGSGSCAPTSANMVIAYYNRLPYWDITASWPSPHTSHYGAYIADKYRYSEIYFSDVAGDSNSNNAWGGYGYMWTGSYSPNSRMADYLTNHNINSVHSYNTVYTDVTAQIDSNYLMPICNLLTSAGHLTVPVGYVNGQHTLIFNDPYGNKNNGTWPNYSGANSYYDWPGYNNGYQNLNQMAWTVSGQATEVAYNDSIIDDLFYNHGFYVGNTGTSHMRYFHDKVSGGYDSHFWYTITSSSTTIDTCYVTWTPQLAETASYEVFAYIPSTNANATNARYKVNYSGGSQTVIINQATSNGWVSLGAFPFDQGNTGNVRLGDGAGVAGQSIAFDAVKWEKVTGTTGIKSIAASTVKLYPNPALDLVNIEGKDLTKVVMTDMLGRKVLDVPYTKTLDISSLSKGVYQVSVYGTSGKILSTEKLIKE